MSSNEAIIIGAGIAGAAAYKTLQTAQFSNVKLIESLGTVGGRVISTTYQDIVINTGAQFIVSVYENLWKLVEQEGLIDDLIPLMPKVGILRNGKLNFVDPSKPWTFLTFSGLSFSSKLRLSALAYEVLRHNVDIYDFRTAQNLDDMDCQEYLEKLLGQENLRYFCDPAIRSVWFHGSESMSRAFLLAALRQLIGLKIYWPQSGLQSVVNAMVEASHIRLKETVISVARQSSGVRVISRRADGTESEQIVSKLVVCIPANRVLSILSEPKPHEQQFFENIEYASTIHFIIATSDKPFEGATSVWFPKSENSTVCGAMVYPQRSHGKYVVGVSLHHEAAQKLVGQPKAKQEEAFRLALKDFIKNFEIVDITEWRDAIPMFSVGHIRRILEFEQCIESNENIYFAGDAFGGPYIEGALVSGTKAADRVLNGMRK